MAPFLLLSGGGMWGRQPMLRQCCECRRIWGEGRWVYPRPQQLQDQEITHGYCDDCFGRVMRRIQHRRAPSRFWLKRLYHYLRHSSPQRH